MLSMAIVMGQQQKLGLMCVCTILVVVGMAVAILGFTR